MDDTFRGNPRLKENAGRAAITYVWGKLFGTVRDMRHCEYKSMMEVALVDNVLNSSVRKMLEQFKQRHKISDEIHNKLLKDLGWNAQEFLVGSKDPNKSAV